MAVKKKSVKKVKEKKAAPPKPRPSTAAQKDSSVSDGAVLNEQDVQEPITGHAPPDEREVSEKKKKRLKESRDRTARTAATEKLRPIFSMVNEFCRLLDSTNPIFGRALDIFHHVERQSRMDADLRRANLGAILRIPESTKRVANLKTHVTEIAATIKKLQASMEEEIIDLVVEDSAFE